MVVNGGSMSIWIEARSRRTTGEAGFSGRLPSRCKRQGRRDERRFEAELGGNTQREGQLRWNPRWDIIGMERPGIS
jgi:hypothetical protein